MKRIARKHFKKAPPVGECPRAPSRHELFCRVMARVEVSANTIVRLRRDATNALDRLTAQLSEKAAQLEKHLNGAKNYEEWARLQMYDKDNALTRKGEAVRELQDRIDWFIAQTKVRSASEMLSGEVIERMKAGLSNP